MALGETALRPPRAPLTSGSASQYVQNSAQKGSASLRFFVLKFLISEDWDHA